MLNVSHINDDVEKHVVAHVRYYMRNRKTGPLGLNGAARLLGVGSGYLSRVLARERGCKLGFVYLVASKMNLSAWDIMSTGPEDHRYYAKDAWDKKVQLHAPDLDDLPGGFVGAKPNPSVASPSAAQPGKR